MSPPTPEGNVWFFSCLVLHYFHQLVCQLCQSAIWCWAGSVQWFYQTVFRKQLPAAAGNDYNENGRVNQTVKLQVIKAKQQVKKDKAFQS